MWLGIFNILFNLLRGRNFRISRFVRDNPTTPFSQPTLHCLKKAGWYPERHIDFKHYRRFLEKNGNPVHPCVENFLSCYGGLHVRHPSHSWKEEMEDFWLNPTYIDDISLNGDSLDDYNKATKSALCAIGSAFSDDIILWMNQDGVVFATQSTAVYLIGNSGEQAIENLCQGTQPGFMFDVPA